MTLSTPSLVIIVNLTRTDFAWAKALGYTGAAWTEADAVEVGGSTADNQIMEYQFLGGQVRRQAVICLLASNLDLIGCHSQVRHYKMVGANHVTEPRNSLAKQILLDVVLGVSPPSNNGIMNV